MSYPIQGLAIIGPIIFLVMAILTPIIGVFAGWKRAAYWGGGNFVVYFGGLAAWKLGKDKISALLQPLIKQLLQSIKIDESKISSLVQSLVAPIFLLILFIVMNLLLLICYYAFAKRCMRIGKFSPTKRLIRAENKIKKAKLANKDKETIAQLIVKKNKWEAIVSKKVNSVGNKVWFNRTVGGISFTVAMLPAILTIPQVITMATTSKETRSKNKFASKIYDFLYKANDKLSWMYYYDTKTATDFDAGFGLLESFSKELTDIVYYEWNETEGKYVEKKASGKLMDILPETLSKGMTGIIDANTRTIPEGSTKLEVIEESISNLATTWNGIMKQATNQVSAMFQSENVTALLEPVLEQFAGKPQTLTEKQITDIFADETFNKVVEDYKDALVNPSAHENLTPLVAIPTTQACIDNMTASFKKFIQPAEGVKEETVQLFNEKFADMIGLFAYVA